MVAAQQRIRQDVLDELAWDSRVDVANVEVEVDGGTVRLAGTVPHYSARQAATRRLECSRRSGCGEPAEDSPSLCRPIRRR